MDEQTVILQQYLFYRKQMPDYVSLKRGKEVVVQNCIDTLMQFKATDLALKS